MKLQKLIVSVDDSHYKDYWPIMAKVTKKVLKVTPVLFKITNRETDFYFDGNGLVKEVKALENVDTKLQTLLYRLYGTKWFEEEVCIISDIDMLPLSEKYFSESISEFSDDDFVVYTSDAYNESDFGYEVFGLCYNAGKGKVFNDILEFGDSFEEFVERVQNFNGLEWFSDEIYLTKKVEQYNSKYKIHKLERGIGEKHYCPTRIEKWNFPVPFTDGELKNNNLKSGNYDIQKLKSGDYYDCHCIRPYGWYKREIQEVADVVLESHQNIKTISEWDYTLVNDRCFVDDDPIVDLGCLNWDWSSLFIGKKRVIGVDPFETNRPFTEHFKGIIGTFDGTTTMENLGISSNIFGNEGGDEVYVKTWKSFCREFNINKISVLKINIEGAEYDLLRSFDDDDFDKIDQIAISFHDWMNPLWIKDTDECLKLLESHHFEILKINTDWNWYLAVKKKRDFKPEITNKKDLILVTSYCDTQQKLETLRNLVNQISKQKNKFDLMVISHTTIPQDISEKTEFTIYDKKNELLYDWDLRCMPWFSPNGGSPITSIYTGFFNTHLAIWRMIILGNSIAKNCGYIKVHHLEYDCDIQDFKELTDNSKLLDYNDVVTYNKSETNVDDIFFGTYQSYRLDTLHKDLYKLDEEKIKRNIKIATSKSPEAMLYTLLTENKKSIVKQKTDLDKNGNIFGLSHHNLNLEHNAWCLPYFDRQSQKLNFIVWNMEGRNTMNVVLIYNDERVIKFEDILPNHWSLIEIDNFNNAKKLIVILNDKIRNNFDFTQDPEAFKNSSYRH